jgi:hypothetical protein
MRRFLLSNLVPQTQPFRVQQRRRLGEVVDGEHRVYIDPVNGSDKNSGTKDSPIATFAYMKRRLAAEPLFGGATSRKGFIMSDVGVDENDDIAELVAMGVSFEGVGLK